MAPPPPPRTLPVPQTHGHMDTPPPEVVPEDEFSNELLVTYISTNGEEECAVVRIDDSYEEILAENWQNRHKDFAREVRNRKGDMVWAAVQPSLVVELGRLGRLPELRLRVHAPLGASHSDNEPRSTQNNPQAPNERSPAYEAQPQQSAVDGIVQAVLHKLFNENAENLLVPGSNQNSGPTVNPDTKARLQELENALLASESQASPPHDTLNSPLDIPVSPPSRPEEPGIGNPPVKHTWQPENNQLPTPQSPLSQLKPWSNEPTPGDAPMPHMRGTNRPIPSVDRPSISNTPVDSILRASAKSFSEGKYEVAVRTLLSACNETTPPKDRPQLFLWLGQVNYEIKEYVNASSSFLVARDSFTALEDRAGRIECEMMLARLARQQDGGTLEVDSRLRQLLSEAKRYHLKSMEIKLLCEICQLACATKDPAGDLFLLSERAKLSAQQLGDMWLKAETSRISGVVSEAKDDPISALQAYSGALELYQGAKSGKVHSPISHIEEVEMAIQRIKHTLAEQTNKSKSRFRRFF
ncbi:unnamed protein product [Rhizoctonia solani]|uniref:Uncharacterized protein n=1 Tax=Rhizoctonia solani TaxID=456999 RepID=A0A8H3C5U8_9AGAM|nr:unnamed protein product [Rhizoctonia solani]